MKLIHWPKFEGLRNINRGGATDTRQTKNEGKHYILWYKVILSLSYTLYDNKEDRVKSDKSKSRQINEYDKPEEEKKDVESRINVNAWRDKEF